GLMQDGTVSDPIEIGPNRSVLIRVSRHEPERALTVSEARDRIVAAIRQERADKRVEADAEAIVERLAKGEGLREIAAERSLVVQDIPGLPRGAPVPDAAASSAYFSAPVPAEGKGTPGKVRLADGSVLVFNVTRVTPGNPDDASDAERDMLKQQLAVLAGREDADTLLRALRRQMKVTVVESKL
ncbi:MAG: peptidylprolyl isomerase, partial [Luteimonas sp.]|nr:peptidylprolyl isomerase [Luteimonas sp.]